LGGCTRWENLPLLPSLGIGHITVDRVRVTRNDSSRVVLGSPRVTGDTLHGWVDGDRDRPAAIPIASVQGLAVREPDTLKTLGVLVGVLLLLAGLVFLLAFGQGLWEWYGEINETE
jgi:hypothetical protein